VSAFEITSDDKCDPIKVQRACSLVTHIGLGFNDHETSVSQSAGAIKFHFLFPPSPRRDFMNEWRTLVGFCADDGDFHSATIMSPSAFEIQIPYGLRA
jgi:hypothetical protein